MIQRISSIRFWTAFVAIAAASIAASAAAPKVDVEISVQQEVVVSRPDGTSATELRPVAAARPGDVLLYTLRATNVGDVPAHGARVDDPIPAGTLLLPDSVDGGGATAHASIDGGRSFQAFPVLLERRAEDGTVERVPAPPERYTHLRWVLPSPIDPGEERNLTFKVRIR